MVVSKVMLFRFSSVVVGLFGGVGVGGTAGAAHCSPSVLEVGAGDCRSEGNCAGSVHSSIDLVVPVLSGSVSAW